LANIAGIIKPTPISLLLRLDLRSRSFQGHGSLHPEEAIQIIEGTEPALIIDRLNVEGRQ
jgi:hypothetical protein